MIEAAPAPEKAHSVNIESRLRAVITGVEDVDLFNEETIVAVTAKGGLRVTGENLHVENLDVNTGKLIVEGKINALIYDEREKKGKGLLPRLLK